jgi:hypothetical protein
MKKTQLYSFLVLSLANVWLMYAVSQSARVAAHHWHYALGNAQLPVLTTFTFAIAPFWPPLALALSVVAMIFIYRAKEANAFMNFLLIILISAELILAGLHLLGLIAPIHGIMYNLPPNAP